MARMLLLRRSVVAFCSTCWLPACFSMEGWTWGSSYDAKSSYWESEDQGEYGWDDYGEPDTTDAAAFTALEIQDDPNNSTLTSCDSGSLKSPGADIDAAELGAGAYLTNCVHTGTVGCESTASKTNDAEGAPDSGGSEAAGEYVSLNGGTLRCFWSAAAVVMEGDGANITIFEVGGTGSTSVEQYRIRVCRESVTTPYCSAESAYASGESNFPTSALF